VFCPNCGTQNPDAAQTCSKCNFHLKSVAAPKFKGTMLMMNQPAPAPAPAPGGGAPQPVARPAGPSVPSKLKGTMVGVAPMAGPSRGAPGPVAVPPAGGALGTPIPPGPDAVSAYSPPVPQPGVNPLGGTVAADAGAFGAGYGPGGGQAPGHGPYGHGAGQGGNPALAGTAMMPSPVGPPPQYGGYNPSAPATQATQLQYGGAPPGPSPYGAPPQGGYGPPPQGGNPYGAQGSGGAPNYGAAPAQPYGAPPQGGPQYGAPPQGGQPYGAPPQGPPQYGAPPNPYGGPPAGNPQGYGNQGGGQPPYGGGTYEAPAVPPSSYSSSPPPNPFAAPSAMGSMGNPGAFGTPGAPTGLAPYASGASALANAGGVGSIGAASSGPSRRNPIMVLLLPLAVIFGASIVGSVLAYLISPLFALLGTIGSLAGSIWYLLLYIAMTNELKTVTRNAGFAWWPIFIPFYGMYWLWILVPQEVTKAKQMLGVQTPTRNIILSDMNDMAR
jgi:hypothetical protein